MNFAVGYPSIRDARDPFLEVVSDYADRIEEVYFPWVNTPSGRGPVGSGHGIGMVEMQERLETDLKAFHGMGIRLNLLFNASCYGQECFSRTFSNQVRVVVEHLKEVCDVAVVTTMSPVVARTVKEAFPAIDVRAGVNMKLGTVQAMGYVAHLFDSFNMQREFNRDLRRIAQLKAWCDRAGKGLHILANSGCLAWCAVQTFHENLMSHEADVDQADCLSEPIPGMCWEYYRERVNWSCFLRNTWIRPEDVPHYRPWFNVMRLATRMHPDPRKVIRAYCDGKFDGNLLELLEPAHVAAFKPYIVDNARFPADWFASITSDDPDFDCDAYCSAVMEEVLVKRGRP